MTASAPPPPAAAAKAKNLLSRTLNELPLIKGQPMPCAGCDAVFQADTLRRCADCRHVAYCSTTCQRAHFSAHRHVCRDKTKEVCAARTEIVMKAAKRLLCTWQQLQAILLVYERMRTEENPAVPLNKQLVLATINQRNGRCMVSLRMASMDECLTETERVALIKCIGSYREAGQCPLCVEALPYTLNARFVVCQVSVTGPAAAAFDEPRMQLYRMLLACARQTLHVLASLSSGSRDDTCLVMKEMEPSADNPDRPALFDAPFTMIRLYATQLFIQGGDAAPVPDDSTATPYTTGSLPTTTSASTTTTTTTTPTAAASQ